MSAHWYGKLLSPASEPFTFTLNGDEGFRLYLEGNLLIDRWDTCCDEMTATVQLIEGTFYDFVLQYRELDGDASFRVEWSSPSRTKQVIPSTNLYYTQRVKNQEDRVFQVSVTQSPTIAIQSTVESQPSVLIAGK